MAWHAVKTSPHRPGQVVLVLGGGPIGLAIIQCLQAQGAQTIVVSEMKDARKKFAEAFGATHVLDPTKCDIVKRCRALTRERGVNVAFDAAGVQSALDQAIDCLAHHGTLVNVALWEKPPLLDATKMLRKERRYQGVVTYQRGDYEEVLRAITLGSIKPEPMITGKIKVHLSDPSLSCPADRFRWRTLSKGFRP